jgi:hypothetical protein
MTRLTGRNKYRLHVGVACLLAVLACFAYSPRGEAAEKVVVCPPGNADIIFSYGDILNCSIEMINGFDLLRFLGSIGETIVLRTAKLGGPGSPAFSLRDPDGMPVFVNAFGYAQLTKSGTHTVKVEEFQNNSTVDYAFTVERVAPPSPTARGIQAGDTLSDAIDFIVDHDPFIFEVGDPVPITIQLTVAKLGGAGSPAFELFGPDGAAVFVNAFGQAQLNKIGNYTILVSEFQNNDTVNYALSLACVSDCVIIPVPDLSGCVKLKGSPLTNRPVSVTQPRELPDTTNTDTTGCFQLPAGSLKAGKSFSVNISGPVVP